jgi:hypothetical protein
VWKRTFQGREFHFYLAGINNQNFLMRDKETGSWWQQITGLAVYGPMKGAALELVPSDELTFGEWKSEVTGGKVFAPVTKYAKEYDSNWEPEVAKLPVVISFPGTELKSRGVVVGLELEGASRAYSWDSLVKQSPVMDRVHGTPLLVAVGPDGKSFRVFVSRIDGKDAEFFLKGVSESDPVAADKAAETSNKDANSPATNTASANPQATTTPATTARSSTVASGNQTAASGQAAASSSSATAASSTASSTSTTSAPATGSIPATASTPTAPAVPKPEPKPWILLDTATGSEWNFQGCAISGPALGKCLDRVPALKDYWFDWRNYHSDTTIYKR